VDIVELRGEADVRAAFAVMAELRSHLTEARFLELLGAMGPQGYRLFALREAGRPVALAGVLVSTNLAFGRYLWVDDLVTTEAARSQGYGRRLLEHVEQVARAAGCALVALASGLQRTEAHRFYEAHTGYTRGGYVFLKRLG
jgi:GNAT superfamily N-acetyltransferase